MTEKKNIYIYININIFEIYFFIYFFILFIYLFIYFIIIFRYAIAYLRTGSYAPVFLLDVSALSPAGAKINELSSMTTYSVPNISFCPNSVEMNSEETLDLPLMAYVPVCGRRTPVMTSFISTFGFRHRIIVTNVTVTCCR